MKALPDVCKSPLPGPFGFELANAFTLAGELTQTLCRGGAYMKHAGVLSDAVVIAEDFRRWLFGDRFEEVLVLRSFKAWSPWFGDVAWDDTWLVFDKRQSAASLLVVTDTD